MEQNRIIAEFLELEEGWPHETDKYGYHQCVDGFNIPNHINSDMHRGDLDIHQFKIDQLKYHTSWDWLMPVVEKIESLGYNVDIDGESCVIILTLQPLKLIWNHESDTKLSAVYTACIKFINWYNTQ
jgi:hypothetical protein